MSLCSQHCRENDRLYVNRLFYTTKKGDVVIFKPSSDPKRPYVKRVIATEGDTVYIDFETGDVYVNDQVIDEPYIKTKTTRSGSYIAEQIASGNYSKDNPIVIEKRVKSLLWGIIGITAETAVKLVRFEK